MVGDPIIELDPLCYEILPARIGLLRHMRSRFEKMRSRAGHQENWWAWHDNMEGPPPECAFAAWKNVFWCPISRNDREMADVDGYQVKGTRTGNCDDPAHLILLESEVSKDPGQRFVLLVGAMNRWRIAGWLTARGIRQPKYKRIPRDGGDPPLNRDDGEVRYVVPEADLSRDFTELRRRRIEWIGEATGGNTGSTPVAIHPMTTDRDDPGVARKGCQRKLTVLGNR